MTRTTSFIALALVAAAVAAPMAQGVEDPNGGQAVDPLAVSYLQNQGYSPGQIKVLVGKGDPLAFSYLLDKGFSPAQITAQATVRSPRETTARQPASKPIDPLAVSYLRNQGFSPGEIKVLVGQGDPLAVSYLRNRGFPQAPTEIVGTSAGFSWSDAGIGAGATLGIVLVLAGLVGAFATPRHNRRRNVASA